MQAPLYNVRGEVVGNVELPDDIFAVRWNSDLVHQVVVARHANARSHSAHAKGRGEVSGGGKKPWRQKGTGRARHGSIRSPLWKGGGATHGPAAERSFAQKVNRKVRSLALRAAISKKFAAGEVKIVDALVLAEPKTREAHRIARAMGAAAGKRLSTLLVPAAAARGAFHRASRNIPNVASTGASSLNASDVLRYQTVVLDQRAIAEVPRR